MAGKGDHPRPRQISDEEWEEKYNAVFRKPKGKQNGTLPVKTEADTSSSS